MNTSGACVRPDPNAPGAAASRDRRAWSGLVSERNSGRRAPPFDRAHRHGDEAGERTGVISEQHESLFAASRLRLEREGRRAIQADRRSL
jgi:hypothetical protein